MIPVKTNLTQPFVRRNSADSCPSGEVLVGPSKNPPTTAWRGVIHRSLAGASSGVLLSFLILQFNIDAVFHFVGHNLFPEAILLGAVVALTPARNTIRRINYFLILLLLLVEYSPLAAELRKGWSRTDPLAQAPAVVVLAGNAHTDGTLSSAALDRIFEGYLVLRGNYAPRLILTRAQTEQGSWTAIVRRQMNELNIHYPIDVVGPVVNTHDEACAVAALAKQNGWDRVILVTSPWHMRRAAAVFESAGIHVICRPCVESSYDYANLSTPGDRLRFIGDWLHEAIGIAEYRWRGWIR
jgi:uncharacterized SAM-binding protein YcdF (DUF218 family)